MKVMFVSSTGGHLAELLALSQRLEPAPDESVWVTHGRANSPRISVIHPDAEVHFVRSVEPRQAGVALVMVGTALRLLRASRPDAIITTGAAVAVPFAVAARILGIRFYYVESAARFHGPSLSGRIVARLRPAGLWCQVDPSWPGWRSAGSVFDLYRPAEPGSADAPADVGPDAPADADPIRRVVVALGTQSNFGFRSAVEAVVRAVDALDPRPEVLWQVGSTDVTGLGVTDPRTHVPELTLIDAMRAADVIVTHAGVGLASLALGSGRAPVLIPRRAGRGEHTDDHQSELADFLTGRGLGVGVEVEQLDADILRRAAAIRIERRPGSNLFPLDLRA